MAVWSFIFLLLACSGCTTSGLHIPDRKSAAREEVYDQLVEFGIRKTAPKMCFPPAGIDYTSVLDSYEHGVKGSPSFLPPLNTRVANPATDDTSERVALHETWTNQAKQCTGVSPAPPNKHKLGWGALVHKWFEAFNDAWQANKAMAEPSDSTGTPWTHYGLMPTKDCDNDKPSSRSKVPRGEPWPVPVGKGSKRSALWWHAQKMAWLLRPNATFAKHLQRLKDISQWEARRPILGLHVRLGDVCTRARGNRYCDDLDTYMEKVKEMANLYGYKSIFLATDSADVVTNTSQYPEFTWIHSPTSGIAQQRDPNIYFDDLWRVPRVPRHFDELLSEDVSRASGGKRTAVKNESKHIPFTKGNSNTGVNKLTSYDLDADAHDFLLDMFLLADTDGFVGKFSSNLDQIAYALGLGQTGCATPYASLDAILEIREQR